PGDHRLVVGRGVVLVEGADAVALSYGPVMLHETLSAAEALRARGIRLAVVNMPWLNRFDGTWLAQTIAPFEHLFVVEDHSPVGSLVDARRGRRQPAPRAGEGAAAAGVPGLVHACRPSRCRRRRPRPRTLAPLGPPGPRDGQAVSADDARHGRRARPARAGALPADRPHREH